jgi:hypothetical protein
LFNHPPIPASTTKPAYRQAVIEEPTVRSDGPANAADGSAEGGDSGQRGSSEDVEDVSFVLPPADSSDRGSSPQEAELAQRTSDDAVTRRSGETSSPKKHLDTRNERPKPQQPAGHARGRAPPNASIVPGISEKELKAITDLNTAKNEVRQFAMDRQIVRVPGPRPPSPDSKLRTSIDREDDERRNSRDGRAKRRAGEEEPVERPVVERIIRKQGPGEDQDYETPARPLKKQKTANDDDERFVRWDRALVVIRDDGRRISPSPSGDPPNGNKSCMKDHQVSPCRSSRADHLSSIWITTAMSSRGQDRPSRSSCQRSPSRRCSTKARTRRRLCSRRRGRGPRSEGRNRHCSLEDMHSGWDRHTACDTRL